MNLGEFHAAVSTALNRGTTLDARIPAMVKMAAQWMERNYSFKHMERFKLLQIVEGDRTILLPSNVTIKAIKFLRIIDASGQYFYPKKVEPEDAVGVGHQPHTHTIPGSYFIVGNSALVFTGVPGEDLNGEAMWYEYTDWPADLTATHYFLNAAADVLLAMTLLNMAAFVLRDARMVEGYKLMRDEGINTLTRATDESIFGGEVMEMQYRP